MKAFFAELKKNGYQGHTYDEHDMRVINATDNSIYQFMPQAVLQPRTTNDLDIIFQTANQPVFTNLKFAPRGGGTGTNGQSLNNVITIDTSRYLNKILEIDFDKGIARVEPGVVLSVLNAKLAKRGYFFPAHVSTANRATLGGMVSTDACGKGSIIYGKTGNHVREIQSVMADGTPITITSDMDNELTQVIKPLLKTNRKMIDEKTPDLPRHFTGYNLKDAYNPETDQVDLPLLIAGSEGSLLMLKEITFNILPLPKYKALFAVSYQGFIEALQAVPDILSYKPGAIETMDNHVLRLAKTDNIWNQVERILPDGVEADDVGAIHCVEFIGDTAEEVAQAAAQFEAYLKDVKQPYYYTNDDHEIAAVWEMRNLCVGLLGNMDGPKRPWPFVEDGAVPPENLAAFVSDVRDFLKGLNIDLGLFGHADAGCLHIRPILDLRSRKDADLIRTITNGMVDIVARHKGNFWGEHGRGLRGEFITDIMGSEFYRIMQQIKKIFDPNNRLNPGKMATAADTDVELIKIDQVPLRGDFDREIDDDLIERFPKAIQCNGNGVCFSAMPTDTMCPSYKATGDRRHSPKGRASLLREWMRLDSLNKSNGFEDDVYKAMSGCLGCKACTNTCPIHVNIPEMKSDFLNRYHTYNPRPRRDYLVAEVERLAEISSRFPRLFGLIQNNPLSKFFLKTFFGLQDPPRPSAPTLKTLMKRNGFTFAEADDLYDKDRVLIVQDAFTSFYEAQSALDTLILLRKCGFDPRVIPFRESGKSRHVKGFKAAFKDIVMSNAQFYRSFATANAPMIGIDPSITLVYRDEYPKALGKHPGFDVLLLQEFLHKNLNRIKVSAQGTAEPIALFSHCTEKTTLPNTQKLWADIFKHIGLNLKPVATGCCGMAGTYGHEAEHKDYSRKLFDLSWKKPLSKDGAKCLTGYSCRAQVKRFSSVNENTHPASLLNQFID